MKIDRCSEKLIIKKEASLKLSKNESPQQSPSQGCCCNEASELELMARLDEIIDQHISMDGALVPVLQTAQNFFGYLPKTVLKHISKRLNIPYSQVSGVVSFYSFFSTNPQGKNLVRVCLGTACYVRGGKEVLSAMEKALGVHVGETTPDRMFSLEVGRCFGACGLAPVVMINDDVHQRVKPAKIRELLSPFRDAQQEEKEAAA